MNLALSKVADERDFAHLTAELQDVDAHFTDAREQHPMRRWEYAMALKAIDCWGVPRYLVDVGGAGSPFTQILYGRGCQGHVVVIDPDQEHGCTLSDWIYHRSRSMADCVICLSVLEHVEDLPRFLYHLSCLTAPNGLLFLTADYRGDEGPDDKHFHWMRQRIFTPSSWANEVVFPLEKRDFTPMGIREADYHGHLVMDYSFVSVALRKRP